MKLSLNSQRQPDDLPGSLTSYRPLRICSKYHPGIISEDLGISAAQSPVLHSAQLIVEQIKSVETYSLRLEPGYKRPSRDSINR